MYMYMYVQMLCIALVTCTSMIDAGVHVHTHTYIVGKHTVLMCAVDLLLLFFQVRFDMIFINLHI